MKKKKTRVHKIEEHETTATVLVHFMFRLYYYYTAPSTEAQTFSTAPHTLSAALQNNTTSTATQIHPLLSPSSSTIQRRAPPPSPTSHQPPKVAPVDEGAPRVADAPNVAPVEEGATWRTRRTAFGTFHVCINNSTSLFPTL